MRVCLVDKNTRLCVNVILLDNLDEYIPEEGIEVAPEGGQVGWMYDGIQWINTEPQITDEQLITAIRNKRDRLLRATVDKINPVRWTAMSEDEQQAWTQYRQDLLDIPQQKTFPTKVEWPNKPE